MASFDAALGNAKSASGSVTTTNAAASLSKIVVCIEYTHATATITGMSAAGGLTWTIDKQLLVNPVGVGILSADAPAGLASSTVLTPSFSAAPTVVLTSIFSFTGLGTGSGSVASTNSHNMGVVGTPASWDSGTLSPTSSGALVGVGGYDKAAGVTGTITSPGVLVDDIHDTIIAGESMTSGYILQAAPSSTTVAGVMTGAASAGQLNGVGVAYSDIAAPISLISVHLPFMN